MDGGAFFKKTIYDDYLTSDIKDLRIINSRISNFENNIQKIQNELLKIRDDADLMAELPRVKNKIQLFYKEIIGSHEVNSFMALSELKNRTDAKTVKILCYFPNEMIHFESEKLYHGYIHDIIQLGKPKVIIFKRFLKDKILPSKRSPAKSRDVSEFIVSESPARFKILK